MGLSASAAAKLTSRLELRLGVGFINRTTRRLALIPEGQILSRARAGNMGAIDAAELRQPAYCRAELSRQRCPDDEFS
jgi:DNA-binding transcriptional LysR family regulator